MSALAIFTAVGVVALGTLVWLLLRSLDNDKLEEIMSRHKATAKISTKADFVEGITHIPVALSLEGTDIFYENPDLQAKLEISRIEEIEYGSELATGTAVSEGKVLRLRSHGHAFEFILEPGVAERWTAALPPQGGRGSEPRAEVVH